MCSIPPDPQPATACHICDEAHVNPGKWFCSGDHPREPAAEPAARWTVLRGSYLTGRVRWYVADGTTTYEAASEHTANRLRDHLNDGPDGGPWVPEATRPSVTEKLAGRRHVTADDLNVGDTFYSNPASSVPLEVVQVKPIFLGRDPDGVIRGYDPNGPLRLSPPQAPEPRAFRILANMVDNGATAEQVWAGLPSNDVALVDVQALRDGEWGTDAILWLQKIADDRKTRAALMLLDALGVGR